MKPKLLKIEQIPIQYHDRIKLNTGSFKIGYKHHTQWSSLVKCVCGKEQLQRNERVLQCIEKWGHPYLCIKCVWRIKMGKDIDFIEKCRKEFLESDLTWQQVASKNNVSTSFITDRVITKLRRLRKHREMLLKREKLYLETEKFILAKQKEDLERVEKSIAALMS